VAGLQARSFDGVFVAAAILGGRFFPTSAPLKAKGRRRTAGLEQHFVAAGLSPDAFPTKKFLPEEVFEEDFFASDKP